MSLSSTVLAVAMQPLLYLNLSGSNSIQIYDQRGHEQRPIASLNSDALFFPSAMATDPQGNLYVAGGCWGWSSGARIDSSTVEVFPPGRSAPSFVYTDPDGCASDLAVGPDRIVVSNLYATADGRVTATVFRRGTPLPWYTLGATTGAYNSLGVALDAHGNCYLSSEISSGGGWITTFDRCSPQAQPRTVSVGATFLWQIRVDRAGDIVAADWPDIAYFHPGAAGPFRSLRQLGMPFALDPGDQSLWTVNGNNWFIVKHVRASDGKPLDTITFPNTDSVGAIAVYPPPT